MALFILFATLVSLTAASLALYQFVEERRRKAISWRRIDKLVVELVWEIENHNFTPDLIIAVGRGGAVVAAMIATNLEGRIELACIDTEVKEDAHGRKHVHLRRPEIFPGHTGRHVLVGVAELSSCQD